jgi:hypothetical protein
VEEESRKWCCGKLRDGKKEPIPYQTLTPKEKRVRFTWDYWISEGDHILEVDIEGFKNSYNIDQIKEYDPIILIRGNQALADDHNMNFYHPE